MKVKYVKFSDERRREFCIKTVIGKDSGIWKVRKTAIFEEGVPHIKNIIYNAELLKKYYDAEQEGCAEFLLNAVMFWSGKI